jgi:hypothetical protein
MRLTSPERQARSCQYNGVHCHKQNFTLLGTNPQVADFGLGIRYVTAGANFRRLSAAEDRADDVRRQ